MSRIVLSLAGTLMGDAWMLLHGVVKLCREHEVMIVAGTYAMPVWIWGIRHVVGADYKIVRVLSDPDHDDSPLCPGRGYISMEAAAIQTREMYPGDTVLMQGDIESSYAKPGTDSSNRELMQLRNIEVYDGDHVAVHAYSRHEWKNCENAILGLKFRLPVLLVGRAGEVNVPGGSYRLFDEMAPGQRAFSLVLGGWHSLPDQGASFDLMTRAVLQSRCMVGVLSSFTNLAALFGKTQIVASFTADAPLPNPRALVIVNPSTADLQRAADRMGL